MVFEKLNALLHHIIELCGIGVLGNIVSYNSACDVVRRCERSKVGSSAVPDKAVTVAYAAVKVKFLVVEMLCKIVNENLCFCGGDIACAVVNEGLVLKVRLLGNGNKIAAEGNVISGHINADGTCLQRGTACVANSGVIAQNGKVCNIGAGLKTVGNGAYKTHGRFCSKHIGIGCNGAAHGSAAVKLGQGVICHTVAK